MLKQLNILIIISLGITLNSCAILFNRNPNLVKIETYPDNVKVFINDSIVGITPLAINLTQIIH